MNTLMRRSPFGEFDPVLESMERAFDSLWGRSSGVVGMVPMDVYEKEDALYIRASIPGLKPANLDLSVEKDVITLRGETRADWEDKAAKVYRHENLYGSFTRSVRLPEGFRPDQAEANFDLGVLTIRVPKADEPAAQSRKIEIRHSVSQGAPPSIESGGKDTENRSEGKRQKALSGAVS